MRKPRRAVTNPMADLKSVKGQKLSKRKLRFRPLAVIVSGDDEQFPELLGTVKSKVDPGITGKSIFKMRQTRVGSRLI